VGQSGYGRYSGVEGFRNFTNRKAILIKGPAPKFLCKMVTPPYTEVEKGRFRNWGSWMTVTQGSVGWWIKFLMFVGFLSMAYGWYSRRTTS